MLFGATARDILFFHMHGIESWRMTMDVDISIQLPDWGTYNAFGREMLSSGFANLHEGHDEKFTDEETGQEVDLLPFGEIADEGSNIIWPNDNSAWSVIGFQNAYDHALSLAVNGENDRTLILPLISIPALVLLKIIAVHDRPLVRAKKDGTDIGFVIQHYLEVGNGDRLKAPPHNDIMSSVGSDIDRASAVLLGRDIRTMTTTDSRDYVIKIIEANIASQSRCYLARGLMEELCKGDFTRARSILKSLKAGLCSSL